jgi:hypothetical protein
MRVSPQESPIPVLLPGKGVWSNKGDRPEWSAWSGVSGRPEDGGQSLSLFRNNHFVKEVLQENAHLDGSFLSTMRYRSAIKDPPGRKSAVLEDPE